MTAVVIPFTAAPRQAPPPRRWRADEIAEVYRVIDLLGRAGLAVSMETGYSDEGDPWLAVLRDDTQDVIVHIARIDGRVVAASSASDRVFSGPTLADALRNVLSAQPLVLPTGGARLFLHPATILAAFIATALTHSAPEAPHAAPAEGLPDGGPQGGPRITAPSAAADSHGPAPRPVEGGAYSPSLVAAAIASVAATIALTSDGVLPSAYRDPLRGTARVADWIGSGEAGAPEDERDAESAAIGVPWAWDDTGADLSGATERTHITAEATGEVRKRSQVLAAKEYAPAPADAAHHEPADNFLCLASATDCSQPLFGEILPRTEGPWLAWGTLADVPAPAWALAVNQESPPTVAPDSSGRPSPAKPEAAGRATTSSAPPLDRLELADVGSAGAEKLGTAYGGNGATSARSVGGTEHSPTNSALAAESSTGGTEHSLTNLMLAAGSSAGGMEHSPTDLVLAGGEAFYWQSVVLFGLLDPVGAPDSWDAVGATSPPQLEDPGPVPPPQPTPAQLPTADPVTVVTAWNASPETKAQILTEFTYDASYELNVTAPIATELREAIAANPYLPTVERVVLFEAPTIDTDVFMLMPGVALLRSDQVAAEVLQAAAPAQQVEFILADGAVLRLLGVIDV